MRAAAITVVLAVVLGGCGGGDEPEGSTSTTSTSTTATSTSTSTTSGSTTTTAPPTSTTAAGAGGAEGPSATTEGGAPRGVRLAGAETVATGLEVPWALAFVAADTILVTERPGRVRVVEGGRLRPEPVATVDTEADGEGGLLGLALHPGFPRERFAYLYYTASSGNRVSRFPVGDDLRFGREQVLLDGIPSARFHDGGALAFGPDGLLHVTTGDARQPDLAADLSSLAGKVLRLRPDGSVPDDNPFRGSPVLSYGHRNPQGLDWDDDGNLYLSEHGPTGEEGLCCHDEVNLVEPGAFYGWPFRAGRSAGPRGGDPPAAPTPPVAESGEGTWAPAGLAVVDGGAGTSLFVANLRARQLLRFDVDASRPDAVTRVEVALDGFGRLRAATTGPDGCLYLTTSNTDPRGDPRAGDDRILRACPSSGAG